MDHATNCPLADFISQRAIRLGPDPQELAALLADLKVWLGAKEFWPQLDQDQVLAVIQHAFDHLVESFQDRLELMLAQWTQDSLGISLAEQRAHAQRRRLEEVLEEILGPIH